MNYDKIEREILWEYCPSGLGAIAKMVYEYGVDKSIPMTKKQYWLICHGVLQKSQHILFDPGGIPWMWEYFRKLEKEFN